MLPPLVEDVLHLAEGLVVRLLVWGLGVRVWRSGFRVWDRLVDLEHDLEYSLVLREVRVEREHHRLVVGA